MSGCSGRGRSPGARMLAYLELDHAGRLPWIWRAVRGAPCCQSWARRGVWWADVVLRGCRAHTAASLPAGAASPLLDRAPARIRPEERTIPICAITQPKPPASTSLTSSTVSCAPFPCVVCPRAASLLPPVSSHLPLACLRVCLAFFHPAPALFLRTTAMDC